MIYTISVVQGCKVSKIDERKLKREKGRTGKDELYSFNLQGQDKYSNGFHIVGVSFRQNKS